MKSSSNMYDVSKIKLVIWDLDDTLWSGVLSEESISASEQNLRLVKLLTDIGIVNSICSKNDLIPVQQELKRLGVYDQFVFISVNWEPKGARIKQLIEDMRLRPANVLFVDDLPSNLAEAKFFCPDLMTMLPDQLPLLLRNAMACPTDDPTHTRLRHYQILEEKHSERKTSSSNEEFLHSSGICVTFGNDCAANLDRIHDLVWRSNQLNFTKNRASKEELSVLFQDSQCESGYVTVSDRFGEYGLVGFYAIRDRLLHFCFSCRTLGMGIEQFVYAKLHRPALKISGEVVSSLDSEEIPGWINQEKSPQSGMVLEATNAEQHSVLIKGPCDLFQILPYITDKSLIDTELTYTNEKGVTIESTGHTTHIVEALRLSKDEKIRIFSEVPFSDEMIYNDALYKNNYRVAVISILTDANLGVYRRKESGERIAFLEGHNPITDPTNWDAYINGEYNCCGFQFTQENLVRFSEQYEFVGINTPKQIVENLRYIRSHLSPNCMLAVMLGGELHYEKNTFPAYEKRHIQHKEINDAIRSAADDLGIRLIDVNCYLVDQSSFYDHFNHYIKPVYYELAGKIISLINVQMGTTLKKSSKLKMAQIRLKEVLAPLYYRFRNLVR